MNLKHSDLLGSATGRLHFAVLSLARDIECEKHGREIRFLFDTDVVYGGLFPLNDLRHRHQVLGASPDVIARLLWRQGRIGTVEMLWPHVVELDELLKRPESEVMRSSVDDYIHHFHLTNELESAIAVIGKGRKSHPIPSLGTDELRLILSMSSRLFLVLSLLGIELLDNKSEELPLSFTNSFSRYHIRTHQSFAEAINVERGDTVFSYNTVDDDFALRNLAGLLEAPQTRRDKVEYRFFTNSRDIIRVMTSDPYINVFSTDMELDRAQRMNLRFSCVRTSEYFILRAILLDVRKGDYLSRRDRVYGWLCSLLEGMNEAVKSRPDTQLGDLLGHYEKELRRLSDVRVQELFRRFHNGRYLEILIDEDLLGHLELPGSLSALQDLWPRVKRNRKQLRRLVEETALTLPDDLRRAPRYANAVIELKKNASFIRSSMKIMGFAADASSVGLSRFGAVSRSDINRCRGICKMLLGGSVGERHVLAQRLIEMAWNPRPQSYFNSMLGHEINSRIVICVLFQFGLYDLVQSTIGRWYAEKDENELELTIAFASRCASAKNSEERLAVLSECSQRLIQLRTQEKNTKSDRSPLNYLWAAWMIPTVNESFRNNMEGSSRKTVRSLYKMASEVSSYYSLDEEEQAELAILKKVLSILTATRQSAKPGSLEVFEDMFPAGVRTYYLADVVVRGYLAVMSRSSERSEAELNVRCEWLSGELQKMGPAIVELYQARLIALLARPSESDE